ACRWAFARLSRPRPGAVKRRATNACVRRIALALLALSWALACTAQAADPRLWTRTGATTLPSDYWQGLATAGDGALLFAGPQIGLYRTTPDLRSETARVASAIPASVQTGERFNHIGDVEFDPREGGRLVLPL